MNELVARRRRLRGLVPAGIGLIGLLTAASVTEAAFGFRKIVRIDAAKVSGSSDLVDFPALISLVDPDLRTVVNGGKVESGSGFDVVFRQGCTTGNLDHEIESYDPVTGKLVAWVRVPLLSASEDTAIAMYYGDAAVFTSLENASGVWDANFKGVWHLSEDPSGSAPQMLDSTVENNDGTSSGAMTSGDQVPGRIGESLDFDGIDDVIDAGDEPELELPLYSWSLWIQGNAAPVSGLANEQPLWNANRQFNFSWGHFLAGFTQAAAHEDAGGWKAAKIATALSAGTWYSVAATYDGSAIRVYLDGALEATQAAGPPLAQAGGFGIGSSVVGGDPFPGKIDEVRVSNSVRSPEWIATAYNNESSPSTFFSVGPELSGADCATNYRSIGTNSGILYATGTATIGAGSNAVTFAGASLPIHVGVGDELDAGGEIFYVLSRDSATEVTVQSRATIAHSGEPYTVVRAYNALQSWESAREGDLVDENRIEVGVVYNDGVFTAGVTVDGSTTDSDHFMKLTVARSQRHDGIAGTGALVNGLDAPTGQISLADDYTVLEWLEVTRARGGASTAGVEVGNAASVLLSHLLAHHNRSGIRLSGTGGNSFTVRNSIVYGNDLDGIRGDEATDSVTVESCTVYGNGGEGVGESAGSAFNVINTVSMNNAVADFALSLVVASNNISSDATAPGGASLINRVATDDGSPGPGNWVSFRSLAAGSEDLHLLPSPDNDAIDAAADLSAGFQNDIDEGTRQNPWDAGADDVLAAGRVALSSASAQSFFVGAASTPAATITITDDVVAASITAAADVRIRIPGGFNMRWDPAFDLLAITGSGSGNVDNRVKALEDGGRTLVLDVTSDFAAGEQINVDGARFFNFTAPSAMSLLELEIGNDDVITAFDDKTVLIVPNAAPTLSSFSDQVFTVGAPDAAAAALYVSDAQTAVINAADDFKVRIPAAFNMEWDTSLVTVALGGAAASKVSATVFYADARTLVIDVTGDFANGDSVTISGLEFRAFSAPSPAANLELDVNSSTYLDDKTIEIVADADVPFFTATATGVPSEVVLEWITPLAGACSGIVIYARDGGSPPTDPSDPMARPLGGAFPCSPAGSKQLVTDPLAVDDTPTGYGAFVDTGSGFTAGVKLIARSFDEATTNVRWAYSTRAVSMAPPGLRFSGGKSFVYAVSNDSILHAIEGGQALTGGQWPTGWIPFVLGAPAQSRPPVLSIPIGPLANGAALVGSQDGQVYAVDAVNGSLGWKTPVASMVQAAPAGQFSAFLGTAHDRILAGTRNSSTANALLGLDLDGNVRWSFTNASGPQLGDGTEIGIISGGVSLDYPGDRAYFASRKSTGVNPSPDTLWCVRFDGASVEREWSMDVGNVDGSPILYQGIVYVGNNAGTVYAVDALSGAVRWVHPLGDGAIKGFIFPQFGTSNLLLSTNTHVRSLSDNVTFATENWNLDAAIVPSPSTPLFVPGTTHVLVGSSDGKLYQIDVNAPLLLKSIVLGSGSAAVGAPSFDVLESMVYVGTDEGVVYAIQYPLP